MPRKYKNRPNNKDRDAIEETETLVKEISKKGNLLPAYTALQVAINNYEKTGGKIEDILPAGSGGSGLGWSLFKHGRGSKRFWTVFLKGIRGDLCDENSDLRKLLDKEVQITTAVVVSALATYVESHLAIIPPIAALIVSKGVKYWCR